MNSRNLKTLALLSIIVPVSLLISFRLTGILQEPVTPETITVESVSWFYPRPSSDRLIDQRIDNSYSDGKASVGLGVHISNYLENNPYYGYMDALTMRVAGVANVTEGFIHSIVIRFTLLSNYSLPEIWEDPDHIELYNVRLGKVLDFQTDSYIEGFGVNKPKALRLGVAVNWFFLDSESVTDHSMAVSMEVTYFDGAKYWKAIIPIRLGVYKP